MAGTALWPASLLTRYGAVEQFAPGEPIAWAAGIIDTKGNPTKTYHLAKKINWEIQRMGPLLLSLKSTAVFHTGKIPRGTKEFKGYGAVSKCEGDGAVLGFFDGPKGKEYLMVVNRNPFDPANVTLTFTGAAREIVEVDRSKSGKVIPVKLRSGKLSLKFSEGDGRLFTWKE